MRLLVVALALGASLACVSRSRREAASSTEIRSACVVDGFVEVEFETRFSPLCNLDPETWCEVELDGDTVRVRGEASWTEFDTYCASENLVLVARCAAPTLPDSATTLDWGSGSIQLDATCKLSCRPGSDDSATCG